MTASAPIPPLKIALIGGSGFVGRQLAGDLWKAGHFVRIIDITPSPDYPDAFRNGDVRDLAGLKNVLEGMDVIVNLAAAHRDDVRPISLYHDVNVTGAQNVCDAARDLGITKIIFTSSVAVYGHQSGVPDENAQPHPFNPYGETKLQAEKVYEDWQNEKPSERSLVIVRPTVVFGPKNRGNVYTLIEQIARNRFLMIGDGTNRKSMAYVENVSAFLAYCLKFGPGQHRFNYIDKPDFSMNDLVVTIRKSLGKKPSIGPRLPRIIGETAGTVLDFIADKTGKSFPISKVRIEKFCANSVFSSEKMLNSGFTPPHDLKDALSRTIDQEFGSAKP